MFVTCEFQFCVAHQIAHHPLCKQLHGHNYRLLITLLGQVDQRTGMIVDFDELKTIVEDRLLSRLDHSYLNDFIEVPTAELVSVWIWRQLTDELAQLYEVQLYEQAHNCVTYRGEDDVFLYHQEP